MKVPTGTDSNGKIMKLPSFNVVTQWSVTEVCQWLELNDFREFVETFKERTIDGSALMDLTQDKLLVQFTKQKIAKRRQLAKCVTECKAQATQAKRQIARCINECKDQASAAKNAVNRIKKRQRKPGNVSSFSTDQEDSDNEWDTDFEEEEEEEDDLEDCTNQYQVNDNADTSRVQLQQDSGVDDKSDASSSSPGTFRSVWSLHGALHQQSNETDEIVLQKLTQISLEDQPVRTPIPKPPNTILKVKQSAKFAVPRRQPHHAPIQRPPSQPPPPPSPDKEDLTDEEYYEIPNGGIPTGHRPAKPPIQSTPVLLKTQHSQDLDDTYEIMDVPEETYEAVDETECDIRASKLEAKVLGSELPPLPAKSVPAPPPLPSKPKQLLQHQTEKRQSSATLVEKLAKDLDEKLKANRYPIQTPTCTIRIIERKIELQEDSSDTSLDNTQGVTGERILNTGAIRKTPPPVHVVKPIVQPIAQQRMSTMPDFGRLLTNRPLPPVPSNNTSNEDSLASLPFFHVIDRDEAEILIKKMSHDGSFLIRPSKRAGEQNPYTITMMHNASVFHINIRRRKDGLFALGREKPQEQTFCDIGSLVTYHKSCPIVLTLKGELSGRQYLRESPLK